MQLNAPHNIIDLIPMGCIQGFAHSRCEFLCITNEMAVVSKKSLSKLNEAADTVICNFEI